MIVAKMQSHRQNRSKKRPLFDAGFDKSILTKTWRKVVTASIVVLVLISNNDSFTFLSISYNQFTGLAQGQVIKSTSEISTFFDHDDDYVNVIVKFKDDATGDAAEPSFSKRGLVDTIQNSLYSLFGLEGTQQDVKQSPGTNVGSRVPKSVQRLVESKAQRENPLEITTHFERTRGVGMKVTKQDLEELLLDDSVELIERDKLVYPYQGFGDEYQTYGIASIQAYSPFIPDATNAGSCLKVCIVDSGLFVAHKDIPYKQGNSNIDGKEFKLPSGQRWFNPKYNHGTHVTGIMVAQADNNFGVKGVLTNAPVSNNVCMLIARVFDDDGNGQKDSVIASAAEWCADHGAKIINLSLGSEDSYSNTINNIYKTIRYKDNALVFAASGNSGTTSYNYPASYDGVISVGAVDKNQLLASYSVTNDKLDLVAPGTDIVSTVPATLIMDTVNSNTYQVTLLEYSIMTAVSSTLVDCGQGVSPCGNAQGKICLLERGSVQFVVKAQNCQQGGGIAAVIYNSEASEFFEGTLSIPGAVNIPVVSATRDIGWALKKVTHTVSLSDQESGYAKMSGTSMAAPFATGVAAKLWSVRPLCSADQIEQALITTAKDLGAPGTDSLYGNGLVQAKAAYLYLQKQPPPCGGFTISDEAIAANIKFKQKQRRKKTRNAEVMATHQNQNNRHRRRNERTLRYRQVASELMPSFDNRITYKYRGSNSTVESSQFSNSSVRPIGLLLDI